MLKAGLENGTRETFGRLADLLRSCRSRRALPEYREAAVIAELQREIRSRSVEWRLQQLPRTETRIQVFGIEQDER